MSAYMLDELSFPWRDTGQQVFPGIQVESFPGFVKGVKRRRVKVDPRQGAQ